MKNLAINLVLVLLIIASLVGAFRSNASAQAPQPPQEVAPYQFGEFSVPMQITNGKIYKVVHEGCELYIAAASAYGKDPSVAIATGRGCK